MKIWFIVSIALVGLCFWVYRATDRPGDDFGSAVPVILLMGLTAIDWLALTLVAIWRSIS